MTVGDAHVDARGSPGRTCPLHYRYAPAALSRPADLEADTLYVAGGLYGNSYALEALLDLVNAETLRPALVFNGDFHWFDATRCDFAAIDHVVLKHTALRGNVETEIAADDSAAGCGCAYPPEVSDREVERSNLIIEKLREVARENPSSRARLAALPMHLVAGVAGMRVGIVHGDAESLAGWSYSAASLKHKHGLLRLERHFALANVHIIASTHTCLPVALTLESSLGSCALFNNGAVGLPNFRGTQYGMVTRIATRPSRNALYRAKIGPVHVEGVPVFYDYYAWKEWFLDTWPPGSPAHESYFQRLVHGPSHELTAAVRHGVVMTEVSPNGTPRI